jgi:hypothetical protein
MSVRVMTAVWALDLPDSDKIVLLALADCANDEGHCWPGMRSLIAKCSKSDRTIQASIKRLVDEGHLTRREVPGKGCNYTVHPRSDFAPEAASPPKGTTQTPEAASGKPSRTINTEAKASSQRVVDRYNQVADKLKLPKVRVLDASRRQQLRLRMNTVGEAGMMEALDALEASSFLKGEGRTNGWRPDFDFLLQPQSLRRLIEGFYGQDAKPERRQARDAAWYERQAAFFESINDNHQAEDCRRKAASLASGATSIGDIAAQVVGRA